MGLDYALVHVKYTIPPAIVLTLIYQPLASRIDYYKVLFLVAIAVVSTTPWDAYLIRHSIWSYPPDAVLGPTLFSIPLEEVFFFVIQTYITSLLYLILNKPVLKPTYLRGPDRRSPKNALVTLGAVQGIFAGIICACLYLKIYDSDPRMSYISLILLWALPFLQLLLGLAHQSVVGLPYTCTVVPVVLPTLYLWVVDTIALRRGTWVITPGTKLGIFLWEGLELEEALFFLLTNVLVVFGLLAFDNAIAILDACPKVWAEVPELPSPMMLVDALVMSTEKYDMKRIEGLREAVTRLSRKSRSFYLASSVFSGRLRIDLIFLYSFCRLADDLIDDAPDSTTANENLKLLKEYLDKAYASSESRTIHPPLLKEFIERKFPASAHSSLCLLPTHILPFGPLYELLEGFKTDLEFDDDDQDQDHDDYVPGAFPIQTESDLRVYAHRVAGTVAELVLELVFYHARSHGSSSPQTATLLQPRQRKEDLVRAGESMGVALQYINVVRDVAVDARIRRVYLPATWLAQEQLSPADVLLLLSAKRECDDAGGSTETMGEKEEKKKKQQKSRGDIERGVARVRLRLLTEAFRRYDAAVAAMDGLPRGARAAMKVAIESYVEIGRVMWERRREGGIPLEEEDGEGSGKATVPTMRRLGVAYRTLRKG